MQLLLLPRYFPKKHHTTFRFLSSININVKEKITEKYHRLEGAYDPENVETSEKYLKWYEEKRFSPDNLKERCKGLILPPPNITGNLHLGHALSGTIQDVISRVGRMRGNQVIWLPGTDHAGIATQTRVEQFLRSQGLSRADMDRATFNSHVLDWKKQYQTHIVSQLKRMGFSLDWNREVFTLDPKQSEAVKEAFIRLFDEGLIYRADHLVNWSCSLRSTVSDIEVENIEIDGITDVIVPGYDSPVKFGQMLYFAYKICGLGNKEIVVATTRPETILGDVAIAVNIDDNRYSNLVGKFAIHPFLDKHIPIVADQSVDIEFGTGAVKITPAHDKFDNNIALNHKLPAVTIINDSGHMINSGKYNGMKRYDARNVIMDDLRALGLLRDVLPHKMAIPICSRSKDVIELLPKPQWYLNCNEVGKQAVEAVNNGALELHPKIHEKVWKDWIAEEKNWCLSRQLWWGHQIPAYKVYDPQDPNIFEWVAAKSEEDALRKIKKSRKFSDDAQLVLEKDTDILDTWFSAGIYPFSIVGWPDATNDYKKLYPYELLITGHDILRFWVYRMVILGLKLTNTLPFNKVLLHGIICDSKGAKMSKSRGNVIDPEDVINGIALKDLQDKTKNMFNQKLISEEESKAALANQKKIFPNGIPQCGADALRFTLCLKPITSHFVQFDVQDCLVNKFFGNKIWQSLKYYQNLYEVCNEFRETESFNMNYLKPIDLWILSKLNNLINTVNNSLDTYELHIAANAIKKFLYYELCDVYVECTKFYLKSDLSKTENVNGLLAHCHTFSVCYNAALRCLAPFMPFVTEELIPAIPLKRNVIFNFDDSSKNLKFPRNQDFIVHHNPELEKQVKIMSDVLSTVRQLKNVYEISNNLVGISIGQSDDNLKTMLNNFGYLLKFLIKIKDIEMKKSHLKTAITGVTEYNGYVINLVLSGTFDVENAIKVGKWRVKKKQDKLQAEYEKLCIRVNTPGYYEKTPDETKALIASKMKSVYEELQSILRFE